MVPIVVIALIAIVGGGIYFSQSKNNEDAMAPTTMQPTIAMEGSQNSMGMEAMSTKYENGQYTAVGDYVSPGGPEQVGVTLTLTDDVITDVEFESMASRPNSVRFQGQFATGYKDLVLGKNIDEVQLTKVSGSSLTPKGFNDALEKIKAEAAGS